MKLNKLNIPIIKDNKDYINNSIDHLNVNNFVIKYQRIIRADNFTYTLTGIKLHLRKYSYIY
jgi:hypothetical protein